MLLMCPFFDDVGALMEFQYTSPLIVRICVSCCFALGVNVSNYLVLGKTSPLTYQVLGHLKTVLVLVLGFTVFQKPVDTRNVIGIFVAMIGYVLDGLL
jgi:solute carrier family 35 protein E3